MLFSTFASSRADLEACARATDVKEVLLETKLLAREGRLNLNEAVELAEYATTLGLKPVLVWDILMTDEEFEGCVKALKEVSLEKFSAVRVQCVGAARYIQTNFSTVRIQLIAETANCNIATLHLWCRNLGNQLERIILSIQLPSEKIAEYVRQLPVDCEILGLGRILLFYSRRNLLLKNFDSLGEEWREVLAQTEDSGSRPFPVIDNNHGTFMYLDKDQCILHKLDTLADGCPAYIRLDLRHIGEFPESAHDIERIALQGKETPEELRKTWPRPTIAPFFKSNLTTKQFKLLNSEVRFNRDDSCVAEVVATERGHHCVLRAIQPFTLPGTFKAIDPTGAEVPCEFSTFKALDGTPVTQVNEDDLVITPWMKRASLGGLLLKA